MRSYIKVGFWFVFLLLLLLVQSCNPRRADTYDGQIEATKIKLSSKLMGTIASVTVHEGDIVATGQVLVTIDTENITVQRKQQQEKIQESNLNVQSTNAQIRQIEAQLNYNKEQLEKTAALVKEGAATTQQRDQLLSQVKSLQAQVDSLRVNYRIALNRIQQSKTAIDLIDIQVGDAIVRSPINGTITNKYHNEGELVNPGTPLVELADLRNIEVHIYVPLEQLSGIKLGQPAYIHVDGLPSTITGNISWIASEAEFTPKTILTKETRTTLVYEVKIDVINKSGILKIGMPVEVTIGRRDV